MSANRLTGPVSAYRCVVTSTGVVTYLDAFAEAPTAPEALDAACAAITSAFADRLPVHVALTQWSERRKARRIIGGFFGGADARDLECARRMSDEQSALAEKAQAEGRMSDEHAHWYASRALHAISASTSAPTRDLALQWMREERQAEAKLAAAGDTQGALECGYAASMLERLASLLRR